MSDVRIISASQVNAFRLCPLQWWFRHIAKEPELRRAAPLVVGSVVDQCIKAAIFDVRDGLVVDAGGLFERAWKGEVEGSKAPIAWGEKGEEAAKATTRDLVGAFLGRPAFKPWVDSVDSVDVRIDLPVVDPRTGQELSHLRLVGVIDIVERDEHGLVHPMEIKTGANRSLLSELEGHTQLALYSDSLRRMREGVSDEVSVELGVKTKVVAWERRVVAMSESARRRAVLTTMAVARAMDLGSVFPVSSWACGGCPHREACDRWQDDAITLRSFDPFAA